MGQQLQKNKADDNSTKLRLKELPFRISIDVALANGFEFKDMTNANVKEFHRFLSDTVYKRLTISQVDEEFLRKRGMADAPPIKYGDIELIHYGKDASSFRLFGYYNSDGYFSVCRIDGKHRTHKSKK